MTTATTAGDIVEHIKAAFELVESAPGRYYIQFPFLFRSGDWLPIALERHGAGWRLTDDSGVYSELSTRTDKDFLKGRVRERLDSAISRTAVRIEGDNFVRDIDNDRGAEAFADFVLALLTVEDIVDEAERRRPSRWGVRHQHRAP